MSDATDLELVRRWTNMPAGERSIGAQMAANSALDRLETSLAHLERGAELLRVILGEDLHIRELIPDEDRWLEADSARKAIE